MFYNPFSFKGRIRRTEFGLSYIFVIVAFYLFSFLVVEGDSAGYGTILIFLSFYWFLLAQSAKRCHDLGQSGFFQLIPFYGFALLFSDGQRRKNKYGQDPKLVELQRNELLPVTDTKPVWTTLPEGKSLKIIGSELLSVVLVTALVTVIFSDLLTNYPELYLLVQFLIVIGGYFLLLLISLQRKSLPEMPRYFRVHRAVFSVLLYLLLSFYELLFIPTYDSVYTNWFGEIMFLISLFILTYPAYLLYNTTRKPKTEYAEA